LFPHSHEGMPTANAGETPSMRTLMLLLIPSITLAAESPIVATVNNEPIRLDEVDTVLKRRSITTSPLTATQTKDLRAEILQTLIDDRLLRQFLKQHGPTIPPADLERHMQGLAISLRRQNRTLAEFLKETGQTEPQLREQWQTLLQLQKLLDSQATDAELKKYFETHREAFENGTIRISHIVVRLSAMATLTERAAANEKLKKLRAEITAGKRTFAAAAKKHSICPSAALGGDLGFITRKDASVDEALAVAAFQLKVGEVSEPVDSDDGVHLVTVTERKSGKATTFERVRDQVRDVYTNDVRQNLLAKLRKQATITLTLPD
jgi:parvulin-like peptidyl-prolyl isomerase